jgi:UDP-2-acetamido-2,6-beta-L-arabino-hexul-4-ose reductase
MKLSKPYTRTLTLKRDARGWFAEILRPHQVTKKQFGQLSFTTIFPKKMKGNHYHKHQHEWFIAVSGICTVETIHAKTGKHMTFILESEEPTLLYIPPLWNHTLLNTHKKPAVVLLYTDVPNDLKTPDVYTLSV